MSKLNATEAPIAGTTLKAEFLLNFHRSDIAKSLGVSEAEVSKLFERPSHRIKTHTKTNESPGGPLQGYDGPLNSNAFLPWAINHARTRLVEKLFAQTHNELIQIAKSEYSLTATDAWTLLRSVERVLSKYGRALDSGAFIEWVREITFGTPLHVRFLRYGREVRKVLKHKLEYNPFERNQGILGDLEQALWQRCIEDTQELMGLSDRALHDALIKRTFKVADEYLDEAKRQREALGGQNVEDFPSLRPSLPQAPTSTRETTEAAADHWVIGYRIVHGKPSSGLSYGNPRSKDFIQAVGKKQEPLQAVETDEWVTAVLQSGPMKLADLKRKAQADMSWGRDRVTSAVKRLGLVKSGLWVRLPKWRNVRAA